jgi:hypothetical protein
VESGKITSAFTDNLFRVSMEMEIRQLSKLTMIDHILKQFCTGSEKYFQSHLFAGRVASKSNVQATFFYLSCIKFF